MSDGRTIWWPKDCGWWRRELVVELLDEFGAKGPAVLDWLSCEAKAQNDGGRVKAGYRTVARGIGESVEDVRHVVSRAVTLVTLEDFEEDGNRFTCRISGFKKDDDRGRAAVRKQAERDRKAKTDATVTERHGLSQNVTPSSIEKRREETTTPPTPPKGGRERERDQFREELEAFVDANYDDSSREMLDGVRQAIEHGKAATKTEVDAFLAKWWPQLGVAA